MRSRRRAASIRAPVQEGLALARLSQVAPCSASVLVLCWAVHLLRRPRRLRRCMRHHLRRIRPPTPYPNPYAPPPPVYYGR
jgi:hypothetical protein